jgi:hypothetical protein
MLQKNIPQYVAVAHILDDTIVILDRSHRQLDFFKQGHSPKIIDLSSYTQNPSQLGLACIEVCPLAFGTSK